VVAPLFAASGITNVASALFGNGGAGGVGGGLGFSDSGSAESTAEGSRINVGGLNIGSTGPNPNTLLLIGGGLLIALILARNLK